MRRISKPKFVRCNSVLGMAVRSLRRSRNATQKQLAKQLGCSHAAVSKMERGEQMTTFAEVVRIAKLFQVPITYFLEESHVSKERPDWGTDDPES